MLLQFLCIVGSVVLHYTRPRLYGPAPWFIQNWTYVALSINSNLAHY